MRRSTAARSVRATSRGDRSFAPIAPDREANIFASFLLNGASPPHCGPIICTPNMALSASLAFSQKTRFFFLKIPRHGRVLSRPVWNPPMAKPIKKSHRRKTSAPPEATRRVALMMRERDLHATARWLELDRWDSFPKRLFSLPAEASSSCSRSPNGEGCEIFRLATPWNGSKPRNNLKWRPWLLATLISRQAPQSDHLDGSSIGTSKLAPNSLYLKTLSLLHWATEEQISFGFAPKFLAA